MAAALVRGPRPIWTLRWTSDLAISSSVLPARELLADLLLELNQPAAALVEYRAIKLGTDPNRFRSLSRRGPRRETDG